MSNEQLISKIDENIEDCNRYIDEWILFDFDASMTGTQIVEEQKAIIRTMALKEGYKIRRQELLEPETWNPPKQV